jgi:hypothetical protein
MMWPRGGGEDGSLCRNVDQRIFADNLARFDLVPGVGYQPQPLGGKLGTLCVERCLAFETGQRRSALNGRSPPRQHVGIALRECSQALCRGLGDQQRQDRLL